MEGIKQLTQEELERKKIEREMKTLYATIVDKADKHLTPDEFEAMTDRMPYRGQQLKEKYPSIPKQPGDVRAVDVTGWHILGGSSEVKKAVDFEGEDSVLKFLQDLDKEIDEKIGKLKNEKGPETEE